MLTLEKIEKLVSLNVKSYQITVDGLRESHDKARYLVGKKGTWDVIMRNLKAAKDSDIKFRITLRTNISEDVMNEYQEYLKYMSKTFGDDKRFEFHFEAAKNLTEDFKIDVIEDEVDAIHKMTLAARDFGLKSAGLLPKIAPYGLVCYAGKNDSFVIDVDGTLMKCTVHITSNFNKIGKLTEAGFQVKDDLMSIFTSKNLDARCNSCIILPICYGKKCPAVERRDFRCDDLIKVYKNTLSSLL